MSAALQIRVKVDATGGAASLQRLGRAIADRRGLHARMAGQVEDFVKDHVASDDGHKTAEAMGAKPTNHMAKTAIRIGSESDETRSVILIPRASRLRAAFGAYQIVPKAGKKYLTIPVAAAAYGKRAGELGNLEFKRLEEETPQGRRWVPYLVVKGSEPVEKMYRLVKKANIKHAPELLPFDEIPLVTERVVKAYFAEILNTKGEPLA